MMAIEVSINGKRQVTASVTDWDILTAHLVVDRVNLAPDRAPRYRVNIDGLNRPEPDGLRHHLQWEIGKLDIADAVTIRLVETDDVDPPTKRYRADPEGFENPYTEAELRQMRYEDYVELKAEFDPG